MKDQIRDLEGLISGLANHVRCVRTNMQNDAFVQRSISEHKAAIARHQKMIEELEVSLLNGPQIIYEATTRMKELRQQVVLLKHGRAIEKLLELAKQVNQ